MNPNRKVLITVLSFVLAMVVIACSCSSLIPSATTQPPSTSRPPSNQEPMPGLVGKWQDPETTDTATVVWQNNEYVVTSVIWKTNSYAITSQSWNGTTLTWSYYDTDLNLTTTYTTTSLDGDSLHVTWSYSDGSGSGTETLSRVP